MKRRLPARKGLSYFDANRNRLITEGPDVLDVKREILARWGDVLEVYFDTWQEEWVIVEKCQDGVDRLVLKTKQLNQQVIDKLHRIDQAAHVQGDLNRTYELEDDKAKKDDEHRLSEVIGENAERLYFALRKDEVLPTPFVFIPADIPT